MTFIRLKITELRQLKMASFLATFSKELLNSGAIRLALVGGIFFLTWELTAWSMAFGSTALAMKADLTGASLVIAASAAAPVGLLTLLANKYLETRKGDA